MKKRSREENAAYARLQRQKKKERITPVSPKCITPYHPVSPTHKGGVSPVKKRITPVSRCKGCLEKDIEISQLKREILLLQSRRINAVRTDSCRVSGWTPTGLITEKYKLRPIG